MTKRIIPLFLIIFLAACGQEAATAVKPATVQTKTIAIVTGSSSESVTDVITAAVAEVEGMATTAVAPLADPHAAKNNIKQIATLDMSEPAAEVITSEDGLVAVTMSEAVATIQDAGSTTVTENVSVVGETAVTNDTPISQPPPPASQPADNGNPPASDTPSQPAPPSNVNDDGGNDDNSGPGNNQDDDDDDHDDDDNSGPGNNHDDDDDDHDDDD